MAHMEAVNVLFIFAMVFLPLAQAQCDGSAETITKGEGEIKNPNIVGGEYNKSANCNWNFSTPSSEKNYVLVLTFKELRLYVNKGGKHCLGSYNLTINQDQTKCDRYVHGPINATPPAQPQPANDFCKAYYSSPTCASVSQIQGCETKQETNLPVSVTYVSDGRTNPNVTSAPMYFKIRYEFIECGEETTTTATVAPATTTTKVTTGSTPLSSTTSANLTTQTTPTITRNNNTIIIAASAGGGGLIIILVIILVICICKKRQKAGTQEIPFQHQNGGTKETRTDQSAPVEENSNPAYQSGTSEYETMDRAGESGSNNQKIEAVEYAATGGITLTDQSGAEMYTTVDLAHTNNQSEEGMYDTEAVTYDKLGGVGLADQSGVEMYSTVGGAHETAQSGGDTYDRLGDVIQTDQSEPERYATVDTPQSVTQSSQPSSGHVTVSDQPESAMYAAVSSKKKGVKKTIHYNKESIDNVLYGTVDDAK